MEIKIATYHSAPNMGAFMQAYALSKYLQQLGHSTKFIQCDMDSEWERLSDPYFLQLRSVLEKESKSQFAVCSYDEPADIQIIGSDEVWNLGNYFSRHFKPFWNSKNVRRTIAYAPCAAGTDKKKIRYWLSKIPNLMRIQGLSARDVDTYKVIQLMAPFRKIERVLDPTFLIEYTDVDKRIIPEEYLLVYTYDNKEETNSALIQYAKEHDLKIAVAGCFAPWADYNIATNRIEWLGLFKFANKVFTTTFHGTVFSIIFRKTFCTYCNGGKAAELCNEFNIHRTTASLQDALEMLQCDIDYSAIENLIEKRTIDSKSYLRSQLKV